MPESRINVKIFCEFFAGFAQNAIGWLRLPDQLQG